MGDTQFLVTELRSGRQWKPRS